MGRVARRTTDLPLEARRLLGAIKKELALRADPERAAAQQAYMKSALPFYGVRVPQVRRLVHRLCSEHPLSNYATWKNTVEVLYLDARYREERYAALGISGARPYREFHTARALAMYQKLIVVGAWWDLVDESSSHVGWILNESPDATKRRLKKWSVSDDIWLRRASIICQVGFGEETDLDLLYACIEPSLKRPEFFLRKGIGWALREVAWFAPAEALRYVEAHEKQLSPLSKREALKNLVESGVKK